MKAILITQENQSRLAVQFGIEDPEDELPPGMYLVAKFGEDTHFETVTEENFDRYFERTGFPLQNDYFEIFDKRMPR